MKQFERPVQIAAILKMISSRYPTELVDELETYLTDLESRQPERPAQIVTILEKLNSEFPGDAVGSLETYLAELEANQQDSSSHDSAPAKQEKMPIWSYQRVLKREQRRREQAKKQSAAR